MAARVASLEGVAVALVAAAVSLAGEPVTAVKVVTASFAFTAGNDDG
jgi:hypothetical protein